jgi:hypothetical protein
LTRQQALPTGQINRECGLPNQAMQQSIAILAARCSTSQAFWFESTHTEILI